MPNDRRYMEDLLGYSVTEFPANHDFLKSA